MTSQTQNGGHSGCMTSGTTQLPSIAAGMNPKTVADRLGHADASVTLRVYTANTSAQAKAAADSLEAGLKLPKLSAGAGG